MVEIFAINFSVDQSLSVTQKYAYMQKQGDLAQLYAWVNDGQYPELARHLSADRGKRIFDLCRKREVAVWVWGQDDYPDKLTHLDRPPLVLYVAGARLDASRPLLSVIGTRRPTHYGNRVTKQLVQTIASNGIGVVSGLARGIDTLAHCATLAVDQYTLVVLAHGLDLIYPAENRSLKQRILAAGGTLCTEYPWGASPKRFHFRDRNRINAALSDGILVVEAGEKSGTKITVHEGLLLNKEIYSIPGPIDSAMSSFPHQLIADGAKMVTKASDILEDFMQDMVLPSVETQQQVARNPLDLQILQYFDVDQAKPVDGFFETSKHCLPEIMQAIAGLEIRGIIQQTLDGKYRLQKTYE